MGTGVADAGSLLAGIAGGGGTVFAHEAIATGSSAGEILQIAIVCLVWAAVAVFAAGHAVQVLWRRRLARRQARRVAAQIATTVASIQARLAAECGQN
jgi:hypothetical protein